MKCRMLFSGLALFAISAFGQTVPQQGNLSEILEIQPAFNFELAFPANNEPAVVGCSGDFNNDGVDDFIITGLHSSGSFLHVYLGQRNSIPVLAYQDDNFIVGGNGSIDCAKLTDDSWMVAIQGGNNANWVAPYHTYVYNISFAGDELNFTQMARLTTETPEHDKEGCGRGSVRLLDVNMDGQVDLFQHGWGRNSPYVNYARVYENQGLGSELKLKEGHGIPGYANTFTVKGDIDGDGKVDLLAPINGDGLYAYFNNGDGTFRTVKVTPFKNREDGANIRAEDDNTQADLIDVDNDGIQEVVLSGVIDNTGGDWLFFLKIYKLDMQTGLFTEIAPTNKAGETTAWIGGQRSDLAIADFDGDGNMDIIVGAENSPYGTGWNNRTYFLSGNGRGGFDQFECTYDSNSNPTGIVAMYRRPQFGQYLVGDFNGDGKKDFVQAGIGYGKKNGGVKFYANVSGYVTPENLQTAVMNENLYLKGNWDASNWAALKEKLDTQLTSVTFLNVQVPADAEDIFAGKNTNCIKYFASDATVPSSWKNVVKGKNAESIELVDGYSFCNTKEFITNNISYTRNFNFTGWATFCLPFNTEIQASDDIEEFDTCDDTNIRFKTASSIVANTPYLINIPDAGVKTFSATNNVLVPVTQLISAGGGEKYLFKPTLSAVTGTDAAGRYVLVAGDVFKKATSETVIPPFRAYIERDAMTPENAQLRAIHNGGDGTTNIDVLNENPLKITSAGSGTIEVVSGKERKICIYSIDGCLIRNMYISIGSNLIKGLNKGVYLIDNQKVLVK